MNLDSSLRLLNLKREDIWNAGETPDQIKEKLRIVCDAKLQKEPLAKQATSNEVAAAEEYLRLTLIDQPPLPKDKLVFIFDFDCTLTNFFTYKDQKWSAALDQESVKANIRCLDQFKQFVKKILAAGHRVAIASFNDIHFDNINPNTGERTLGGYHLIKHYLQVIFEDEPEIVEKIIIQAYQTIEDTKTTHTDNIRNCLKASKEQTVLSDDTPRHVNKELKQGGNAFLVTEHNFAKLLDRYDQALSDSSYIKNPIKEYPDIPTLEKKLATVLTAETFAKEYQAFYDLFSVNTKATHLLKLLDNNNADEKLIEMYLNDKEVFSAACGVICEIDGPFSVTSGASEKQTFSLLFKTLCETVSAKNTQIFKAVIEKIKSYNFDWKTIDFNTDSFVRTTHAVIRWGDGTECLNNKEFAKILLPFLPEEQQIVLIMTMLKYGHYYFLNEVAAYNATILDKLHFTDIGKAATSDEIQTEVRDFLIKKYRSTFQVAASTATEISDYLLFEIKLDNFKKLSTLLQQLSDHPDCSSIKTTLINQLIDSHLPDNKIPYFKELLMNPPIDLLTKGTTKQRFFIRLIRQLDEVSVLQQIMDIYGSSELDLFELFGTAVRKVAANKSSEIALFILEKIITAETVRKIIQVIIDVLGVTHPFLSQAQHIFAEKKLNYSEPSLDEKLLMETNRYESSPDNIKTLLEQGAKVPLEVLEKELTNENLQLFSKLAEHSDPVAVKKILVSSIQKQLTNTHSLAVDAANKLLFCLLFRNCFQSENIYPFMESFLYKQIDSQIFSDIQFLVALGIDMNSSATTDKVPLDFANDLKVNMLEKKSNESEDSDGEVGKDNSEYQDLLEIIEFLELKTQSVQQENQSNNSLASLAQQIKNNSTPGVLAWFKENTEPLTLNSATAFPLLYKVITHGNILVLRMLLRDASQDFLQIYGFQLLSRAVQSSLTFKEKELGAILLSYIFTELAEHGAMSCLSEPGNILSLLEKILNNFTVPAYSPPFLKNAVEVLLKKIGDSILKYPQVCEILQNNLQALTYLLTPAGNENLQILLNEMPKFEKEPDSLEAMVIEKQEEPTVKRKALSTGSSAKAIGDDLSDVFRNNASHTDKQEEEIPPSKKSKQEEDSENTSYMDFFSNH